MVNEDSPQQVRALAEHVYKNIFDKDVVYPNILLRTYAKNIIDYARHIGCVEDGYFDAEKITPPYNSRFPEIPSDEEIKTYKLDYNSESFRDYHWSQLAILNSMKVEYSRSGQPGGYGDFGRYTFQSYFYAWKQLHPIDLKNIAIKRIFELGYDVEKHGKYDRNLFAGSPRRSICPMFPRPPCEMSSVPCHTDGRCRRHRRPVPRFSA